MLNAPTTITLRRPSADADLVISRLESGRTRSSNVSPVISNSSASGREVYRLSISDDGDDQHGVGVRGLRSPSFCSPRTVLVVTSSSASAPTSRRSSFLRQESPCNSSLSASGEIYSVSNPATPVSSPGSSLSSVSRSSTTAAHRGRGDSGSFATAGSGFSSPVARIGSGLRRAKNGFLDCVDSVIEHFSRSPENECNRTSNWVVQDVVNSSNNGNTSRKVSIETNRIGSPAKETRRHRRGRLHRRDRKARSANDLDIAVNEEQTGLLSIDFAKSPSMRHNLSTSLALGDLRDGIFTAQFPLDVLSQTDDIRIRVTETCLDMFVSSVLRGSASSFEQNKSSSWENGGGDNVEKGSNGRKSLATDKKNKKRKSVSNVVNRVVKYVGTVDLPIYVDANRLRFDVDHECRTLLIQGHMKGYFGVGSRDDRTPLKTCCSQQFTGRGSRSNAASFRRQTGDGNAAGRSQVTLSGTNIDVSRRSSAGDGGIIEDGWYRDDQLTVVTIDRSSSTQMLAAADFPPQLATTFLVLPPGQLGAVLSKSWPNLRDY